MVLAGIFFFSVERREQIGVFDKTSLETEATSTTGLNQAEVKEFSLDEEPFSFSPSTITVNQGDTVRITVRNLKGIHDAKIDEFSVTTRILNAGEEQVITFVADKAGVFEYYCSVGNHRALGMVGTLTVR